MDSTDLDIETLARTQAAEIAASQQKVPIWQTKLQQLAVTLHLAKARSPKKPKPGKELLLWSIKQASDLSTALALVFELFQESSWVATVPKTGDVEIMHDTRKRSWNEAAAMWSKEQTQEYIWVQYDRQLLVKLQPPTVGMFLTCNDIHVQHDTKTSQLSPVRQQQTWHIGPQEIALLERMLPSLTPQHLYQTLLQPKAPENLRQRQSSTDSFVHSGPLRAGIEVYTQQGIQPTHANKAKEDANKALSNAIVNLLKSNPP